MPRAAGIVLCVLMVALPASKAEAGFATLETADLRMIYDDTNLGYLAPYAARCFENSLQFHRRFFDYKPSEKISVILTDSGDYGNAGAGAVPQNAVMVEVGPTSLVYETYPANERINTLMNHELVHIVALDQAAGSDVFFRGLFRGKVRDSATNPESILYGYLTAPRTSAPRWFHEGEAVFTETWMAGGYGRALGAYDEMVFRSMVRDGSRFYDPIGLLAQGTQVDFQVGVNAYLYGTRFMSYLALTYSPEQVRRWVQRKPGSRKYYASQFDAAFDLPLEDAWKDWVEWEHEFQEANLDSLRLYPMTPCRDLARKALGSVSRAYLDRREGEIYVGVNYPGSLAHLAAIDVRDGSMRTLVNVKGPALYFVTSLAYDPAARVLFYTTDNNAWRDLHAFDLRSGRDRLLLKDARIGDLAFCPADRSLWGIRSLNGLTTLVRMDPPYRDWTSVHTWPFGEMIYDLDVSADGSRLSLALAEPSGRQSVCVMDAAALAADDTTTTARFDFGAALPGNFVFTPDGSALYGSTYYTGVSNIFRYTFRDSSLDCMSNCETGLFRPIPAGEDSMVVFRYSGDGFIPAIIHPRPLEDVSPIRFLGQEVVEKHPVVRRWMAGSPGDIDIESRIVGRGSYHGLEHLALESVYPVVEGYKSAAAYGLRINVSDPISMHVMDLTTLYSPAGSLPADERLHVKFRYHRYNLSVRLLHNGSDFYDLVGPTKTGRKGSSAAVNYTKVLFDDAPKKMTFRAGTAGYMDLERLPDAQNVASSFDKLLSGHVGLSYQDRRFSLGAVEYEKGYLWNLDGSANYVNGRLYPAVRAELGLGIPLPIPHASLWLRPGGGLSPGDRSEPFANFYFGGFGNNWVDHGQPKQYREYYSFPGVELNELSGRNFGRFLAELNLPPWRFRRMGRASLFAKWLRPTLFATGLVTDIDAGNARRWAGNAGAQVDIRLRMLSHLNMTLSFGYAGAFRKHERPSGETMASLKIL